LLVKGLKLREKQALSSFERLSDNLTLSEAIRLLLAPTAHSTPSVVASGAAEHQP
jgi:hypothetical protein